MAPASKHSHRDSSSSAGGSLRSRGPAVFDNSSAAAALMGRGKLTTEAGMAAASQAAMQSKLRAQQKHQEDLRCAALTSPQQRNHEQIELLCDFLSSSHLLRHLQPTNIKDLAQTMAGRSCADGELLYTQHDTAKHFYVVLCGEVVMYEADSSSSTTSGQSGKQQGDCQTHNQHHVSSASPPQHVAKAGADSALDSGKHSPNHTPRTGRSAAAASKGHGSKSSTPRSHGDAAGSSLSRLGVTEVRRVGPREAFGEEEVITGSTRQQSAVAGGANSTTWTPGASHTGAAAATSSLTGLCNTSAGVWPLTTGVGGSAAGGAEDSSSSGSVQAFLDVQAHSKTYNNDGGVFLDNRAVVVLQLCADDYGAVLAGRLSAMLEEKLNFLGELPALKGLNGSYLRSLAHCFHQVHFDPREAVVRQGELADCMYVIMSGQVCVLIDPNMTLSESGALTAPSAALTTSSSSLLQGDNGVDTKKLVQVCLLGSGSIVGDMSVREGADGPPKRSATVVALTELITYKVPLKEFKRRMPADVLEGMRQVASQKLVMNERQASSRTAAAAAGKEGHILLGGLPVPEAVLRGKELRALLESQQTAAPVGSLLEALEVLFATSTAPGNTTRAPAAATGSKAQEVDEYIASLTRHGFIAAPPAEFLALLTDWHSPRTATEVAPADRRVPVGREFPLPLPQHTHSPTPPGRLLAAKAISHEPSGQQQPPLLLGRNQTVASPPIASTHFAVGSNCAECFSGPGTWGRVHIPAQPTIHVDTHVATTQSTPGTKSSGSLLLERLARADEQSMNSAVSVVGSQGGAHQNPRTASNPQSPTVASTPRCVHNQQQSLPVSSPRAFRDTLDQLVQQKQQQGMEKLVSHCTSSSAKCALQAHAVIREATQQLTAANNGAVDGSNQSPFLGPARGGGFKGTIVRAGLAPLAVSAGMLQLRSAASAPHPAVDVLEHIQSRAMPTDQPDTSGAPEPNLHEAQVKASSLFRPGSPVAINCGASRQGGKAWVVSAAASRSRAPVRHRALETAVHHAADKKTTDVLRGLGDMLDAAVVINSKGKPQLEFHAAEYTMKAGTGGRRSNGA